MKNGLLRILNDLDSAGQGKKEGREGRRDEEERGTRRKEGRGGRRNGESEKMKNEKVAKARIIGLAEPCLDASSTVRSSVRNAFVKFSEKWIFFGF